jgi:hypothetical protein
VKGLEVETRAAIDKVKIYSDAMVQEEMQTEG